MVELLAYAMDKHLTWEDLVLGGHQMLKWWYPLCIRWPPYAKMLMSPLNLKQSLKMLGHLEYQKSNTKHLSYVQKTLLDGHQLLNTQFQPNLNIRFSSTLMMILFTYYYLSRSNLTSKSNSLTNISQSLI